MHAIDTPYAVTVKRNRERPASVPEDAIERMMLRCQPPQAGEAHGIVRVDGDTHEPVQRCDWSPAPGMEF